MRGLNKVLNSATPHDEIHPRTPLSAERGWIGDPQPSLEWHDSHYSRQADRLNTTCQYHVLPVDDPLRALNILREAVGPDPLPD